jgi:hypothetical protein
VQVCLVCGEGMVSLGWGGKEERGSDSGVYGIFSASGDTVGQGEGLGEGRPGEEVGDEHLIVWRVELLCGYSWEADRIRSLTHDCCK